MGKGSKGFIVPTGEGKYLMHKSKIIILQDFEANGRIAVNDGFVVKSLPLAHNVGTYQQ